MMDRCDVRREGSFLRESSLAELADERFQLKVDIVNVPGQSTLQAEGFGAVLTPETEVSVIRSS